MKIGANRNDCHDYWKVQYVLLGNEIYSSIWRGGCWWVRSGSTSHSLSACSPVLYLVTAIALRIPQFLLNYFISGYFACVFSHISLFLLLLCAVVQSLLLLYSTSRLLSAGVDITLTCHPFIGGLSPAPAALGALFLPTLMSTCIPSLHICSLPNTFLSSLPINNVY